MELALCKIYADTREKLPMAALKRSYKNIQFEVMKVGDYRCKCGMVGIERKEEDLSNMSTVLRQVEELKATYEFAFLIVTKNPDTFLHETPAYSSRMGFLASLATRRVPAIYMGNYEDMIDFIYYVVNKLHDGKDRSLKEFNPVRHVSKKDLQLNALTALPGIGKDKAALILSKFGSIRSFLFATPKEIMEIEGIGKKTIEKLDEVLGPLLIPNTK